MAIPNQNVTGIPQSRSSLEKTIDQGFIWITRLFAWGVIVVLLLIGLPIAEKAIPAIQQFGLGFLFNSAWNPVTSEYGAFPMIYGTLVSSFIALLFAVPLGLGTAIFLSEDFIPLSIRTALTFLVQLLAAIPSVVYGLWGIFVLIPFFKTFSDVFVSKLRLDSFVWHLSCWPWNVSGRCGFSNYDSANYYGNF
jgi:phosphate transport system permease protein